MRILGHPLHVMLIHFPIALWPAHWALHVASAWLPQPAAALVAFWLLVAGTGLGWLAALAGAADLIELFRGNDGSAQRAGLFHAAINGTVLVAFSALALLEYARYPAPSHGAAILVAEAIVLGAMFVGNYFGGRMVWATPAGPAPA